MAADDRPGSRDEDRDADRADREAIDRAFADLVAGYHLTAERTEPPAAAVEHAEPPRPGAGSTPGSTAEAALSQPTPESPSESLPEAGAGWADDHPLFRFEPEPHPDPVPELEERFEPPEPEPLPKPAWPVLGALLGMGYAVLTMLAVVVGVRLPSWAGWLAIIGFVGGFGLLVSRLPRERPPGSGDGAVL